MTAMPTLARRTAIASLGVLLVTAELGLGVGAAASAAATPGDVTPCTETGTIAVTRVADGTSLGHVAAMQNFGEFTASASATPLSVTGTVGTQGNLTALNSDSTLPLVGASVGNQGDTLAAGSTGYTFLDGVTPTDPGAAPADGQDTQQGLGPDNEIESAIWTLGNDGELTPTWVNPDDSDAPTTVFYDADDDYLGLTGDLGEFTVEFEVNAVAVTLRFDPTTPLCPTGGAAPSLPDAPYPALIALTALPVGVLALRRRRSR